MVAPVRHHFRPVHKRRLITPRRSAFSLVELTAVLLVLAIVVAAVGLGLQGPMHKATMGDVVDRIGHFDRLARSHARRNARALRMMVDLGAGRMWLADASDMQQVGCRLSLPRGYFIARLMASGQDLSGGTMPLPCSAQGLTPSYAICVEGPGGRRAWLLAAGLTGTITREADEEAIRAILAAAAGGTDAG